MTSQPARANTRLSPSITALVTVALVAVITLLFAAAGLIAYRSYRAEQWQSLRARHRTLADQLAAGLASPLWNFDRPTLAKIADGALKDAMVTGLSIRLADDGSLIHARTRDAGGRSVESAREPAAGELLERRPIVFEGETIGAVEVWATSRWVEQALRTTRLVMIGAIVGFDVVLVLGLYVLLRRIVLRPLGALERYALAVSSGDGGARGGQAGDFRGELASLQASLVSMVGQLDASLESTRVAYTQLSQLNRRLESAKDEERRLLSRELHDELGQMLTALKLRLKMMNRGAPGVQGGTGRVAATDSARVEDAVVLVDGLIDRVRKISVDLRPPLLDELGLESALRAFLDSRAKLAATRWQLETDGLSVRLAPEIEMTCFRVVQEAVTNVLRHARAERARVHVRYGDERLAVTIVDDGQGVSPAQAAAQAKAGHLGLVGMRERARSLGGEFTLSSPPSSGEPAGTRIDVVLPAPKWVAGEPGGA